MKNIFKADFDDSEPIIRVGKYYHKGVDPHWHSHYEFELILEGEGTYILNNAVYSYKRGDMFFMRVTDFHSFVPDSATQLYCIRVPMSRMPENVQKLISAASGNLYAHFDENTLNGVISLCELLQPVCWRRTHFDQEYAERIVTVIICTLLKHIDSKGILFSGNSRFVEICQWIQEHFKEDIDIPAVAAQFNLNKNYLCSFFKKNSGMTLHSYIRDTRLQYAARLASLSEYSSGEICEMSGYGSYSNFLRDFKKRFGISPLQMRQNKLNLKET